MTLTHDLTPVTKITLKPCPTDATLHEVLIERDIGSKDGARSRWQFFLGNDEMMDLENIVSSYNRAFVEV